MPVRKCCCTVVCTQLCANTARRIYQRGSSHLTSDLIQKRCTRFYVFVCERTTFGLKCSNRNTSEHFNNRNSGLNQFPVGFKKKIYCIAKKISFFMQWFLDGSIYFLPVLNCTDKYTRCFWERVGISKFKQSEVRPVWFWHPASPSHNHSFLPVCRCH